MKVLADTSVWSLALRRRDIATLNPGEAQMKERLADAISDGRVMMIGPIRQELLSGIRENAQFEALRAALQPFRDQSLETPDYEKAAQDYNTCRSQGVLCGPVDILICSVAHRRNWHLLTSDAVMRRCLEIIAVSKPPA